MLDIQTFSLKKMKEYFKIFASLVVFIAMISIIATYFGPRWDNIYTAYKKYSWFYLVAIVVLNLLFERHNKKEFASLGSIENFQGLIDSYIKIYKRRLIVNGISVILTSICVIISHKMVFLVVLLVQLILIPVFYPRQVMIAKELNKDDLHFTD